ncbi:MAG: hypothetical protein NTU94_13620 [Planctomycetota bacterium]|nr:hypothetical protein [Planctomycetota bacterium]
MNVLRKRLVTAVSAVLGVVCLAPATGSATGTCYAFMDDYPTKSKSVDGGPPVVLRYIYTSVGEINTDAEAKSFAHLKQMAFSLVGKASALVDFDCKGDSACPAQINGQQMRLMTTIDGAIITGRQLANAPKSPDSPGAHMGINMQLLRLVPNWSEFPIGPVTLDCSSDVPGPNPPYWMCNIRAEFDVGPIDDDTFLQLAQRRTVRLDRVTAAQVPACSVFQDGSPDVY